LNVGVSRREHWRGRNEIVLKIVGRRLPGPFDFESPSVFPVSRQVRRQPLGYDIRAMLKIIDMEFTERERAEERERVAARERRLVAEAGEATAKFRAIFDQSSIFSGVLSVDGIVVDANRICLEACGYTADDVLGLKFWETPWWRGSEEVKEKIRVATIEAAKGRAYREELPYWCADGSERVVDFAIHPVRDESDEIIFLHPTGMDITERMQTELELRTTRAELEERVRERTAELNKANESLRNLSARLLHIRDEEARRLARELHDSAGQMLSAMAMNIASIASQAHKLDERGAKAMEENSALVEQISTEIRTISYLLHPPLLDELGLRSALTWYVEGFSERSKIKVDLEIAADFGRLSTERETAIFRIVQECLTNIHRHSGSKTAVIRILQEHDRLTIVAEDAGKGIPADKLGMRPDGQAGVGFRGMAERLRYLGGNLNLKSNANGSVVTATMPLEADDSSRA
jgi:PAS domain S-box-containing protein